MVRHPQWSGGNAAESQLSTLWPGQPNYYIAVHWHALELHLTRPWPLAAVSGAHRVNIPWSGSRSWARPPLFGAATKVTDSRLSCLGCAEPRPGQDPLWRWMGPDIGETGDISWWWGLWCQEEEATSALASCVHLTQIGQCPSIIFLVQDKWLQNSGLPRTIWRRFG